MHPLTSKIDALQSRLLWQRRLRAACWIFAAAVAFAFLLGLADYLVRFNDPGLRILSTVAWATAVTYVAYRAWYVPSRNSLSPLTVARRVESHFPQLSDSLASAIEFLQQSEHDPASGSAQLRRLVIAEAQNQLEALPINEVADTKTLRRAIAAAAASVSLLAICFLVAPASTTTSLTRLVAPLGAATWPREHHLVFRDIPEKLTAGENLELELIDSTGPMPDNVHIQFAETQDGVRHVTSQPAIRASNAMLARRENVQHSFGFRAEGGDDDSMRWHWVEVIQPPKLESLTITVHPPSYSGLPSQPAERHLEVLAGTSIELAGTTDRPISAARIVVEGGPPIDANVSADAIDAERRSFHIVPDKWIANKSGPYELQLTDANGLESTIGKWNLRVEEDSPPGIKWQQPSEDLLVLPRGVVPISVAAQDNLAIRSVRLSHERTDRSESERAAHPKEDPILLYQGPERPHAVRTIGSRRGESREVSYDWDLEPLGLPVGAQITIQVEADDYHGQTSRATGPRRISIIDAGKLEARLADQQTQIVRQLERVLAIERAVNDDVGRIAIDLRDLSNLSAASVQLLQSAEQNQRRVNRELVDPNEGVTCLVNSILAEFEMNRIDTSPTRDTMERLAAELQRLQQEPLSTADRELTAARKISEQLMHSDAGADQARSEKLNLDAARLAELSTSIATASKARADVIAALEQLISELSKHNDASRFIRQLTELRQDQISHESQSRAAIGLETLPLNANELSRAQRATLTKAAAGEDGIATRYEKIEQGLDQLAPEISKNGKSAADTIVDAVNLARQLNIAADMRQAVVDLRENRVGQALERERQIAAALERVLQLLKGESERKPDQFANKLREAEQTLEKLREQTAALRMQVEDAEEKSATITAEQQARLANEQQNARQEIEKLSRELRRLQATEASKSTQSAANNLADEQKPDGPDSQGKKPATSGQIHKAEDQLKRAADRLAQQRQQAEDDLALEFVRRFQSELTEMVERQKQIVQKTTEVESARNDAADLPEPQAKLVAALSNDEQQLAAQAKEHSELLTGLAAVRVSLEESEQRLLAAAKLLTDGQTGAETQAAERNALKRLEGMLQAFAQTANEAGPKPSAPPPTVPAGNNAPQQQRRPTFELLQAKMLRMLQADLAERTLNYQQRLAAATDAEKRALQQEAQQLAAEQGHLADLVESMLHRDNEQQEQR